MNKQFNDICITCSHCGKYHSIHTSCPETVVKIRFAELAELKQAVEEAREFVEEASHHLGLYGKRAESWLERYGKK